MAGRSGLIRAAQMARMRAVRPRTHGFRGDPGLFGSIGKILGKVAPIAKVIPGVGNVLSAVGLAGTAVGALKGVKSVMSASKAVVPYTGGAPLLKIPSGIGGVLKGGALVAGGAGAAAVAGRILGPGTGRRYRRMNPLNHKAATRAVRRIKAVRKLCRSIESSLPKQKASCRSGARKR